LHNSCKKGRLAFMRLLCFLIALLFCRIQGQCQSNKDWIPARGPYGADVRAFAQSGYFLFVGTLNGGIYRSADQGISWEPSSDGLTAPTILAMASLGNALLAGTYRSGIFRSADQGKTWKPVALENLTVRTLLVLGKECFAGTERGGIFRSSDGGLNWEEASKGLQNRYVLSLTAIGQTLFAATGGETRLSCETDLPFALCNSPIFANPVPRPGSGVYRSDDKGKTWTLVNKGLSNTMVQCLSSGGGQLFAGTLFGGVFRSSNLGASWTPVSQNLIHSYVLSMAVSGPYVYAGTLNGGVYRLPLSGSYWTPLSQDWQYPTVWAIGSFPGVLLAGGFAEDGFGADLYRSTNQGLSWKISHQGLCATLVWALAAQGDTWMASTDVGLYESADKGKSWKPAGLAEATVLALATLDSHFLAATYGKGLYLKKGKEWEEVNEGLQNRMVISLSVSKDLVLAGSLGGVHYARRPSLSWKEAGLKNLYLPSLAIGKDRWYAGNDGGSVYFSQDKGYFWTQQAVGYNQVSTLLEMGQSLFAGIAGGGVFRSDDQGQTWTEANEGLQSLQVSSLVARGSLLFAGTFGRFGAGIYRSDGQGWTLAGLANTEITCLLLTPHYLLAGTRGKGIWMLPLD
jgi:photosystem II stability/assembly factor-like uncharacterized protein